MDINEIRKLVKLVESSRIDELEIQEESLQIRIRKGQNLVAAPPVQALPQSPAHPADTSGDVREAHVENVGTGDDKTVEILSPMVGTFYRAASPDSEPYIKEGDTIEPGRILCLIEAMKLMNEIEAEISGKIVKILVDNAQPVEYNHPLFLVEKH